jgi:hypothetical protein
MTPKDSRGEMILRYQNLYEQYSRLQFTRPQDRPIAIDGIQNRLLKALHKNQNSSGGFGVFDDGPTGGLLHRSLLWHRDRDAADPAFARIVFPPNRNRAGGVMAAPPSWSWMAYTGAIRYLEAGFDRYAWVEVHSPWSRGRGGRQQQQEQQEQQEQQRKHLGLIPALTMGGSDGVALTAELYDIVLAPGANAKLYYDQPGGSQKAGLQGIVLAIKKPERVQTKEERLHYVMMVGPRTSGDRFGMKEYERVGVCEVIGKALVAKGFTIRIV